MKLTTAWARICSHVTAEGSRFTQLLRARGIPIGLMTNRLLPLFVVVASPLIACGRPAVSPSPSIPAVAYSSELRNPVDEGGRRANIGQLTVIVRSADRPELALQESLIQLIAPSRDTATSRTDAFGIATLTATGRQDYTILVWHVGTVRYRGIYRPRPGCHERLEVYLGAKSFCETDCGFTPPRAVLTTCAPDA